ncbi:DUF2461 domain-containing protein [Yoonia sp. 2307UL14-13]|uniref:DUF2461 domain-containing protein n=1 Tax=Yoonia sp. 2307UL14-13 TaxID=3126506 RepID=UPI0030B09FB3
MTYATLISDAKTFYTALNADNTKAWWQEHKATYDDNLKAPALALLEDVTSPLSELADAPIKTKLFRPHRDVRFSKDKTPYNTHLHMMWQTDTDAPQNPVFFFGVGLEYVTAGVGMMGFDKPVLANWRKMVDLDTDRILRIVGDIEKAGFELREPELKRVPAPFDKDHEAGRLLRMKGVTASQELSPNAKLPDALVAIFREGWPLNAMLLSVAAA